MKWLILLTLISACGKHTQPKADDIRDSDGDHIQNYMESDFDKYVANIEELKEVKGVIRFTSDINREFSFSNSYDRLSRSIDMITGNEKQISYEEYFSEWSKTELNNPTRLNLNQEMYNVTIEFADGSDEPNEVLLLKNNIHLRLGNWSKAMKVRLTSQDLASLVAGESKLVMVKKFKPSLKDARDSNLTIKEKTYRVYVNDGNDTQVYYVSKDLEFEKFLAQLKIEQTVSINEDYLFFGSNETNETKWFSRELSNGEKVAVKSNFSELRKVFLKRFDYQKKIIGRNNGKTLDSIFLQNKEGSKVYLRVNSLSKTFRTFSESSQTRGLGGGGREGNAEGRCTYYTRRISSETVHPLNLEEMIKEISTESFNPAHVETFENDNGTYWEMKLDTLNPNSILSFNSLSSQGYHVVGEYRSSCGSVTSRTMMHTEGKLSIEVESYVEKI